MPTLCGGARADIPKVSLRLLAAELVVVFLQVNRAELAQAWHQYVLQATEPECHVFCSVACQMDVLWDSGLPSPPLYLGTTQKAVICQKIKYISDTLPTPSPSICIQLCHQWLGRERA